MSLSKNQNKYFYEGFGCLETSLSNQIKSKEAEMEFDGRDEEEQEGPPCLFQALMPGPWRSPDARRYQDWGTRWFEFQLEVESRGEATWREHQVDQIETDDLLREQVRQFDALVKNYRPKWDGRPRLVRR